MLYVELSADGDILTITDERGDKYPPARYEVRDGLLYDEHGNVVAATLMQRVLWSDLKRTTFVLPIPITLVPKEPR